MKLSEIIQGAIDKKGFKNLKTASKAIGISPELLRVIISKGHIPKDTTLALIAKRLGLDMSLLVLAAHQEKVPTEVKGFFLMPSPKQSGKGHRRYPISEEQTAYLGQILSTDEIEMLRKLRQMSDEGRTQASGFINFLYASKRAA
jgi:hypothetical protein